MKGRSHMRFGLYCALPVLIFITPFFAHANDTAGQTDLTYIFASTLETKLTLRKDYRIPLLNGDTVITRGSNFTFSCRGEISPVSVNSGMSGVLTPVAFMEIDAGAKIGTGWNIGIAHGLSKNRKVGDHGRSLTEKPFIGAVHQEYFGAAVQFDAGEVIEGRWTHVLLRTYHQGYYKGLTSADKNESWLWEADEGENRNGWHYYSHYIIGYKTPYALDTIVFMFEAERSYYDIPSWSHSDDNQWRYKFSNILHYRLSGKTGVSFITQIRTVPNYTEETEDYGFYQTREINRHKKRKWEFYRVALELKHEF